MTDRYFTIDEAHMLLGSRWRATAGYANVPSGTTGKVVDVYRAGPDEWGVTVEWERPQDLETASSPIRSVHTQLALGLVRVDRVRPLQDGFSRDDLELVFVGGPYKGRRAMEQLMPGEL